MTNPTSRPSGASTEPPASEFGREVEAVRELREALGLLDGSAAVALEGTRIPIARNRVRNALVLLTGTDGAGAASTEATPPLRARLARYGAGITADGDVVWHVGDKQEAQSIIEAAARASTEATERPDLRAAAKAVADYSWGLHLAGTPNEREAIDLIEALRAALTGATSPSEPRSDEDATTADCAPQTEGDEK